MHILKRLLGGWLALCLLLPAQWATAEEPSLEYSVKGAFLFKFAAFVEWPGTKFPAAGAPLVIGILGEDPFGLMLDKVVRDRTILERPVVIRRMLSPIDTKSVHVLFISRSETERWPELLPNLRGSQVLTVGEFEPNSNGVVINFVVGNRVRFDVDLEAASHSGLKLSSKLLQVARSVRGP